ncbi:MAG: caspase family protein [Kiritimatiellae bacterium]|nr:caspase family protein [Kiritimatiellia bacterium]
MKTKSVVPLSGEKYALLVAVEAYHDKRISKVIYAENAATELAASIQEVGFPAANTEVMLSASATKTRIESAVRTLCRRLRPEDELMLFYAGHGFAENGHNFITCHDTVLSDLPATSIRLQTIFEMVRSSKARKAVILLDCCHSGFKIDDSMRGLLTEEMMDDEFAAFCSESEYHMAFASCRLDEKSYPSNPLKHGIWSHHVIQAYRGEEPKALERKRFLTASSLRDYLSAEVPRTLRHTVTGTATQNPRVWGDMSREFILADLGDVLARRKAKSKSTVVNLARASFFGFVNGSVKMLKGFKRHHRVPDNVCSATRGFVQQVGADDLREASEAIHHAIKTHFSYRRRYLELSEDDGAVTIMTPQFTVNITLDIDNDDPSQYEIATEVTDIRDPDVLDTEAFAEVFDDLFDRIVFQLSDSMPIEDIIDAIEDIDDPDLISVTYPANADHCTIRAKGLTGELMFDGQEITIRMKRKTSTTELLGESRSLPNLLLDRGITALLPSPKGKP